MAYATLLKRCSAVCIVAALCGPWVGTASAQDNLARVNQDELASFYGRMNVVVGSGARAFGMGGAFLARADDATAASWNPAGLSYLRRAEVSLVGAHNDFAQRTPKLNAAVEPQESVIATDQLSGTVADFLGFVYPLRIKERAGAVQISYQRSFSFTGTRRSEGPVGVRGFLPESAKILPTEFTVQGNGGFDTLSLSSGFEVHPRVRLGVSLNRWINGFQQTVNRPDAQTGGYRRIDSTWDISGTNVNVGALITPTPKLNLGAVFKSPFEATIQLSKAREDKIGTLPSVFNQESGDVLVAFPRVYGLGASLRASNTITFSADFTRTAWSKASITNFFSLGRRGGDSPSLDRFDELPFPAVEEGANGQADTTQVRVGAEWVLRFGEGGDILLPVRAGFFRDGQPVVIRFTGTDGNPLEEQPSFLGFTAGFGVTVGGALFDVAYIREAGSVRTTTLNSGIANARREIRYHRVFASMMLRFGPRR